MQQCNQVKDKGVSLWGKIIIMITGIASIAFGLVVGLGYGIMALGGIGHPTEPHNAVYACYEFLVAALMLCAGIYCVISARLQKRAKSIIVAGVILVTVRAIVLAILFHPGSFFVWDIPGYSYAESLRLSLDWFLIAPYLATSLLFILGGWMRKRKS
ncbi:MAG: hypothetical protein FWH26_03185 [Oscillospiraceae bacterium]|nr:hypothetical protein [Oscillospiraceae bacterium]